MCNTKLNGRAVGRLSEQMRQVSRAPKARGSPGNLLNLFPLKCYFQHFFFQHHEVFLQNSTSCRPKTADKMKLKFERLCLWCTPPFDCLILCRVSLHLVCAKFFQGSPLIAKFRQANFSFLLSEILRVFYGNFVLHGRMSRPFHRNGDAMRCKGDAKCR